MFFLVVAGAVHTRCGGGVSFLAGVAEPLFETVIPWACWGLQLLVSTWSCDAGNNACLCVINECLAHLYRMVFLVCPIGSST